MAVESDLVSDPATAVTARGRDRTGLEFDVITVAERFWPKVDKTGECWIWLACVDRHGYGRFAFRGTGERAHRVSYILKHGSIPDGLVLDHLCRNTLCVNPDHLEAVTQQVNIYRGVGYSATNKRKTHCIHGHEFTPGNTKFDRGARLCRTCHNRYQRDLKRRKKAA